MMNRSLELEWVAEDALRKGLRETDRDSISADFGVEGKELDEVIDDIEFIVKNEGVFIEKSVAYRISLKCFDDYGSRVTEDEYTKAYDDTVDEAVEEMVWWKASDMELDDLKDRIFVRGSNVINA